MKRQIDCRHYATAQQQHTGGRVSLVGMGQLRDVLWSIFASVFVRIFAAILICDIGDAHIEDVFGTNWDVGGLGDVVLDDVWIFDEGACNDLAAGIADGGKR